MDDLEEAAEAAAAAKKARQAEDFDDAFYFQRRLDGAEKAAADSAGENFKVGSFDDLPATAQNSYDDATGMYVDTTNGIIHYDDKGGAHIVPSRP